ncbi:hypothetical protein P3L10_025741 [Capsicum annuum]
MSIMNIYATCLNLVQLSLQRRNQIKFRPKKWREEKKKGGGGGRGNLWVWFSK